MIEGWQRKQVVQCSCSAAAHNLCQVFMYGERHPEEDVLQVPEMIGK